MRTATAAFAAGLIFGLGLTVSRMIDPAKVKGFLDILGDWDPSLALVMGGALAVTIVAFAAIRSGTAGERKPAFAPEFQIPARRNIDNRLLVGAAVFGVGWGLAGLCPGPAISALATGRWEVGLFVVSMIAGMWIHSAVAPYLDARSQPALMR